MRDYLITAFIIVAIVICSGCASEIESYNGANPASERSGKIGVWKGLGVELTLWEYKFKGKDEKTLTKEVEEKPEVKP